MPIGYKDRTEWLNCDRDYVWPPESKIFTI